MSYESGGKIDFCRKARQMVNDEETGRQDYTELIGFAMEWENESLDPDRMAIGKILKSLDAIRLQEEGHQAFLRRIVDSHCKNVGT